jgi:hypothetical protein
MKKLFAGCLVVALLGAVALAVGGFFAWRMAQPYMENAGDYVAGFRRLGELGDLDRKVANTAVYEPAATGELSETQVQRFVRVQERVRTTLGERFADLQARYTQLDGELGAGQRTLSFGEAATALSALSGLVVDARRIQVEAINAEGFSQSEYNWVRTRIYQAAGIEATGFSLDDLQRFARQGPERGIDIPEVTFPEVPARNRDLVRPHVPKLKEWVPLAFFGL